ncbi:MAG: hypothetical protein F6J93_10670 [Oscillatoria sp. SIO1A7]|nr:hypothetical protein [Oscillatoria sp. SIO1A7]
MTMEPLYRAQDGHGDRVSRGDRGREMFPMPNALHPTPYTLHPIFMPLLLPVLA